MLKDACCTSGAQHDHVTLSIGARGNREPIDSLNVAASGWASGSMAAAGTRALEMTSIVHIWWRVESVRDSSEKWHVKAGSVRPT